MGGQRDGHRTGQHALDPADSPIADNRQLRLCRLGDEHRDRVADGQLLLGLEARNL